MTSHDLDQTNFNTSLAATVSETLASISLKLNLILTLGTQSLPASQNDQSALARPQIPIPVHQRRT